MAVAGAILAMILVSVSRGRLRCLRAIVQLVTQAGQAAELQTSATITRISSEELNSIEVSATNTSAARDKHRSRSRRLSKRL